jgi:hypothetical protein
MARGRETRGLEAFALVPKLNILDEAMPGSLEELKDQIRSAVKQYIPQVVAGFTPRNADTPGDYCYIAATFPDHVIVEVYQGGRCSYWEIDYEAQQTADGLAFSFSNAIQVQVAYVPIVPPAPPEESQVLYLAHSEERTRGLVNLLTDAKASSKVQTLIMSKARFKTADEAKKWARDNGFSDAKVDEPAAGNTYRLRQFPPGQCTTGSMATISMTSGVKGVVCVPKAEAAAEPPAPPKDSSAVEGEAAKPELELSLEGAPYAVLDEDKIHWTFRSVPIFDADKPTLLARMKAGDNLGGKAPLFVVGRRTKTDRTYSADAAKGLLSALQTILDSGKGSRNIHVHKGPWPTGAMYPLHDQAMSENNNALTDAAARFTGVYVEGGKRIEDIADGDVIGVSFVMLSTQAGKDTTAVLLETDWVAGLSLRGFVEKAAHPAPDGSVLVDSFDAEAFGGDFVMAYAAPFPSPASAKPALEGAGAEEGETKDDKAMGKLTLEELKTQSPELYDEFLKNQERAATAARLEGEAIAHARRKGVDAVLDSYRPKLDAVAAFDSETKTAILDEFRAQVESAVASIVKDRPDLDPIKTPERFLDAVAVQVDAKFKAVKDRYEKLLGRAVAEHMRTAGFPEGLVAAPIGGVAKDSGQMGSLADAVVEGFPYVNTLPYDALCIESDNERVGLPRGRKAPNGKLLAPRVTDVLMSMASGNVPVYVTDDASGTPIHVLDKYRPGLRAKIAEMSKNYMKVPFIDSPGATKFTDAQLLKNPDFQRFRHGILNREKMTAREADEMVSSTTLPTLYPDIRQGIIEKLYAQAVYLSIATIVPCDSTSYQIYYEEARRTDIHIFGQIAQGGSFATTGDEGALTSGYEDRGYMKVLVQTATAAVCTINYTNENGTAKTATVAIPDVSLVGAMIVWYPEPGDRIKDITGGAVASWTAGTLQFVTFEPPLANADQITAPGKARTFLATRTGTVGELALQAELAWAMIEDANRSLAMHGPGRYDVAARVVANVANELTDYVDRVGFDLLNNATDFEATNTMSFDVTAIAAAMGGTIAEAKATLLEKFYSLQAMLYQKGLIEPDWLAVNYADRGKLLWVTRDVIRPDTTRADAFFRNQDWGVLAGMSSRVAFHQNHKRFLAGASGTVFHAVYVPLQLRGPFPFAGGHTTDVYVSRMRVTNLTVRPETRGYIEVSND